MVSVSINEHLFASFYIVEEYSCKEARCTLDSDANVTLRVDKTSQLDAEPTENDIIISISDIEKQIRGL